MAKKKVKAPGGPRSAQYTSDVLKSMGIVAGRSFLTRVWPDRQISNRGSSTLLLRCVVHDDNTPSMNVDFVRGSIKCFGCNFFTTSIFELMREAKGWSYRETAEQLRQHTTVKLLSDAASKEMQEYEVHLAATAEFLAASNTHLQNLLAPPPDKPYYTETLLAAARPTLEWLFKERGRDRDLVSRMPYGVLPPRHVFDELVKERNNAQILRRQQLGQPLVEKEFREAVLAKIDELWKAVDSAYIHAVVFVTGYSLTSPGRIRLRRPGVPKSEGLTVLPGAYPDAPNGYFGLYCPARFATYVGQREGSLAAYMIEGEMDALACLEGLDHSGKSGVLFLASCGSANDTDALAEAGINRVRLVSDEPGALGNGDAWVAERLRTASEVDATVFSRWRELRAKAPEAKDPDEVIRAAGFAHFYDTVVTNARGAYRSATEWAVDKISDEIEVKHVDRANARAITEIAGRFGQCVNHPASQAAFIEHVAQLFHIAQGPLRQEIVQARDTEESFRLRITERMRYEFHTMYKETSAKGHVMTLYHKRDRERVRFPMADGEAIAIAMCGSHGNFYDYVKSHIGIPGFLTGDGGDAPVLTPEKTIVKDLHVYMKLAAQDLFRGLPDRRACVEYNQGVQWLDDPDGASERIPFFVNGSRVYRGKYLPGPHMQMEWEELAGPSYGRYLFREKAEPWSHEVTSVQDLLQGNSVTLDDLRWAVETIERAVRGNWTFAHQDTDPTFLAFHLVACATTAAFPMKAILSFTGDHHSGKSTILSLFGGVVSKSLQVLEHALVVSNPSAAAFYQNANNTTLLVVIDEFENEDEHTQKGQAVANITQLFRNMIGESGAPVHRGTADGSEAVEYRVHTNAAIASILRAKKIQDESRRFEVELRKNPDAKDPAQGVFATVTPEEWQRARRIITIATPRLIPTLHAAWKAIDHEVNTTQLVPFKVSIRYLRNMFQACAVMHVLGYDWRAFLVRSCQNRRAKLQAVASDTAASVLHDRLFRSPGVRIGENVKALATLLELLADEKEARLINESRSGVYFIPESRICVINWITVQAKNGLLEHWADYRGMDHRNLKHTFDQHPQALRSDDYVERGVRDFLVARGDSYRAELISAIDLTPLLSELRDHRVPAGPAPDNVVPFQRPAPPLPPGVPAPGGIPGGTNNIE